MMIHLVVGLVRAWTRVYTWRLLRPLRDERRAEIESDLWESQHDPNRAASAAHMFTRLLIGMSDDVSWRVGQAQVAHELWQRKTILLTAAAAVAAVMLWSLPMHVRSSDRTRVIDCAHASPAPLTRADLRLEVVTCAGAFFTPHRAEDVELRIPDR